MSHIPIDDPFLLLLVSGPTAPKESLADKLLASFVSSNFHDRAQKYIPAKSIRSLITQEEVEEELKKIENDRTIAPGVLQTYDHAFRRSLAMWTSTRAQKIFAICVTLEFNPAHLIYIMDRFRTSAFDDESLPLEDACSVADPRIFVEGIWSKAKLDLLDEKQWCYLAPIFTPLRYKYDLWQNCIFPFTKDSSGPKVGAFGSVCMVTIHPDHQEHENMKNVRSHLA